jgi:hypothetical protein
MKKIKEEIRKEIKEEFSEEIKEVIYEQAKKEIKEKVKTKAYSIKDRFLRFLGVGETQEQRIRRISSEIASKEDILLSDSVLGTVELFTSKFSSSFLELLGIDTTLPEHGEKPKSIEKENEQAD